jgi:hypothetical protein
MGRLNRTADLVGAAYRVLVCQTRTVTEGKNQASCSLPWMLERLGAEFA